MLMVFTTWILVQKPSHDRVWELGQDALPYITTEGNDITITNLRDFAWTGPFEAERSYTTGTFRLDELKTVDVIISHFDDFEGLAHIFLSFGFTDGRHVSVSLEARREVGEEFSPWLGLARQFEIVYVVGTDRDLIGVRTGHRNERVYLYPTIASPEKARELFLLLAKDINAVYAQPVFYNTLLSNCTNRLTRRVEQISEYDFPLTYKSILPGYFDEVLYDMGLIGTDKPFAEVKNGALVDNTTVDARDPNYAVHLRERMAR
jgi:hypothetical protein